MKKGDTGFYKGSPVEVLGILRSYPAKCRVKMLGKYDLGEIHDIPTKDVSHIEKGFVSQWVLRAIEDYRTNPTHKTLEGLRSACASELNDYEKPLDNPNSDDLDDGMPRVSSRFA